jgi:hypothetical protein
MPDPALDSAILAVIKKAYGYYWAGDLRREPRIGASLLVDELRQTGGGDELMGEVLRKYQYEAVRSALARLVTSGKLEVSIGISSDGREERQYNPPLPTV